MKSETIIAQRFIKDHMIVHGLTPQSVCIDYPLIKLVKSAGVKYKCYQEQQQNEKQKNEVKYNKRQIFRYVQVAQCMQQGQITTVVGTGRGGGGDNNN